MAQPQQSSTAMMISAMPGMLPEIEQALTKVSQASAAALWKVVDFAKVQEPKKSSAPDWNAIASSDPFFHSRNRTLQKIAASDYPVLSGGYLPASLTPEDEKALCNTFRYGL